MSEQHAKQTAKTGASSTTTGKNMESAKPDLAVPGMALQRAYASPHALSPSDVMALQRTVGNQVVQRLLNGNGTNQNPPSTGDRVIQRKLVVGPAKDKYEQEADTMAQQVMRMPAPVRTVTQRDMLKIQTKAQIPLKSAPPPITPLKARQRREKNKLQASRAMQAPVGMEGGPVNGDIESSIRSSKGGGKALPDNVRSKMEGGIGANFNNVRIHTGNKSNQLNRSLGAQAFTSGSDIFFQNNSYNPHSSDGTKLLAHELTHVVQQGAASQNIRRSPDARVVTKSNVRQRGAAGVVQRKGNADALKKQFLDFKLDVIGKFQEENWPQALSAMKTYAVAYKTSGWWGGTSLAKKTRGLSTTLEPMRVRSKNLMNTRDSRQPDDVTKDITRIAADTGKIKGSDFSDGDIQYGYDMLQKISFYLAAAIPPSIRSMFEQYVNFTPDLTSVLTPPTPKGGNNVVKSDQVKNDEVAIKKELTDGSMATRGFHGSASWLLEGLGKSDGKLLSQKAAFNAGLLKTGEGTTFSSGASLKSNVYIGKGEMGFSTAASYALAPGELTSYNVSLFSDEDLHGMISTYEDIIQHEEVQGEMGKSSVSGANEAVKNNMLTAAKQNGIDPEKDKEYARLKTLQNKVQLEEMLGKLQKEMQARQKWSKDDDRREGGKINADNYPILLDFDLGGLTATDDIMGKGRVAQGDYRLAGEATVADEIDLTKGRLKVVYCPEQFIARTTLKLKAVFGDDNTIQVRALEAISDSVDRSSDAGKTLTATYGQLEKQEKLLNIKIKAQGDISKHMLDYVDKNQKGMLHSAITKSAMGNVPSVASTEKPEAVLMMGGPGSGKSTIIESILNPTDRKNMVLADPDSIKAKLPQYREDLKAGKKDAATKAHAESKKIVKTLLDNVISTRRHLLYDATGANKKDYEDLMAQLKRAGYNITLVMTHVPVEEGLSRVKARATETGRDVPESIVRAVYTSAPKNFKDLAPTADDAFVFDNSAKTAKLVWNNSMDVTKLNEIFGIV
jgi:predicted ABC-type ATPase